MVHNYKSVHSSVVNACLCTFLLALAHMMGVSRANFEHSCDYNSVPHSQGICGSQLSDLVGLMCHTLNGGFFTKQIVKREAEQALDDSVKGILLNKKEAFSYLSKRHARGSIICECCYNRCTHRELLQYCALPPMFFSNGRP